MIGFSIVIPTYNRIDSLTICLDILYNSVYKKSVLLLEIIVSDDSNNEITYDIISKKYSWVKWVRGPQKGPAANRNNGAKFANHQWLIFLDDDCVPDPNLVSSYYDAIVNSNASISVLEGKIEQNRAKERFNEEAPINLNGSQLWSCNFCIKRDVFYEVGQFDEKFPFAAMEDIDLYERLKKSYQILFVEKARVFHPWRKIKLFKNFKKRMLSYKIFVDKYYSDNKSSFRISRVKIFIYSLFSDFIKLYKFRFRGILYYFELSFFNFLTIFL